MAEDTATSSEFFNFPYNDTHISGLFSLCATSIFKNSPYLPEIKLNSIDIEKETRTPEAVNPGVINSQLHRYPGRGVGKGVLPYMGFIGMGGPKRYGYLTILVINRVSILTDFDHFGHK